MLTICVVFVSAQKFRVDDRCGTSLHGTRFAALDGTMPAQCDAGGSKPCCSKYGHCGVSRGHCACPSCIDYRKGAGPYVRPRPMPRSTSESPMRSDNHLHPSHKPSRDGRGQSRIGLGGTVCKTVYGDDRISCFDCEKQCLPCGFVCRNPGPDRPMPPRYAQPSLDLHHQTSDPQKLSGTLPSEIGMLSHLQNIYLYDNLISGTLPVSLFQLSKLSAIDIDDNGFSGTMPTQIGLLSNLRTLRLEANRLSGTLPSELARLTLLQAFSINNNLFVGTIPDALANPSFQPRSCHLTNTQKQLRRVFGTTPAPQPDTNRFICPLPALTRSCLESSPGSRLICHGGIGQGKPNGGVYHNGSVRPYDLKYELYNYGHTVQRVVKTQPVPRQHERFAEEGRPHNSRQTVVLFILAIAVIAAVVVAVGGGGRAAFIFLAARPFMLSRCCPKNRIALRNIDHVRHHIVCP